jgi:aspartate oxidase
VLTQAVRHHESVRVAERVRVREIDDDEDRRLLRIIRRGSGSVVTWRRSQMVLLSAPGMAVADIAEVTFTSADRVRGAAPLRGGCHSRQKRLHIAGSSGRSSMYSTVSPAARSNVALWRSGSERTSRWFKCVLCGFS